MIEAVSSLHQYRIVRLIGSGGMARVYEAIATSGSGFERRVAIKQMLPIYASDPSMQHLFFHEAQVASSVHHGNVVRVLDYGMMDGSAFIAMEYIDGIDARRATTLESEQGRKIPEAIALHIASEVAHALEAAHRGTDARGRPLHIVHRDVSPQNILLSWDGDVKLSDFGIALSIQKTEKTRTGVARGKVAYIAPEQALDLDVDAPADVYALGATLHALITGEPPARTIDPAADALLVQQLVLSTAVSSDIARIISACMSGSPGRRPTAGEVARQTGELALRGLSREARGSLKEWIAPLQKEAAVEGPLDDLINMWVSQEGPAHKRSFTMSSLPTEQSTKLEKKTRASKRIHPAFVISGALLLVGIVGVLLTSSGLIPNALDPRKERATRSSPAESSTGLTITFGPVTSEGLASPTPSADAVLAHRSEPVREPPRSSPRSKGTRAAPQPSVAPIPNQTVGFLRVGGTALRDAVVVIDGDRQSRRSPSLFRIPVGNHHVVVKDPTEAIILVDRHLAIDSSHSSESPASIVVQAQPRSP